MDPGSPSWLPTPEAESLCGCATCAAEAQPMRDTEDARLPFWSPDGRKIGFFASRKLKTIDIAGGRAQIVCDIRVAAGGGAWHADDVIIFAPDATGPLYRVPGSGGTPAPVTPVPTDTSSQFHRILRVREWTACIPVAQRLRSSAHLDGSNRKPNRAHHR